MSEQTPENDLQVRALLHHVGLLRQGTPPPQFKLIARRMSGGTHQGEVIWWQLYLLIEPDRNRPLADYPLMVRSTHPSVPPFFPPFLAEEDWIFESADKRLRGADGLLPGITRATREGVALVDDAVQGVQREYRGKTPDLASYEGDLEEVLTREDAHFSAAARGALAIAHLSMRPPQAREAISLLKENAMSAASDAGLWRQCLQQAKQLRKEMAPER